MITTFPSKPPACKAGQVKFFHSCTSRDYCLQYLSLTYTVICLFFMLKYLCQTQKRRKFFNGNVTCQKINNAEDGQQITAITYVHIVYVSCLSVILESLFTCCCPHLFVYMIAFNGTSTSSMNSTCEK